MEFHMINITYAALHMRAQTEKTKFSCKDDCRSILERGKGLVKKSGLYPARAYTTLVVLVIKCHAQAMTFPPKLASKSIFGEI